MKQKNYKKTNCQSRKKMSDVNTELAHRGLPQVDKLCSAFSTVQSIRSGC